MTDSPPPMTKDMIKEETVQGDGRTLIYYTFPEDDQEAPALPRAPEAAHV